MRTSSVLGSWQPSSNFYLFFGRLRSPSCSPVNFRAENLRDVLFGVSIDRPSEGRALRLPKF